MMDEEDTAFCASRTIFAFITLVLSFAKAPTSLAKVLDQCRGKFCLFPLQWWSVVGKIFGFFRSLLGWEKQTNQWIGHLFQEYCLEPQKVSMSRREPVALLEQFESQGWDSAQKASRFLKKKLYVRVNKRDLGDLRAVSFHSSSSVHGPLCCTSLLDFSYSRCPTETAGDPQVNNYRWVPFWILRPKKTVSIPPYTLYRQDDRPGGNFVTDSSILII